jgi:hypothetical protein
LRLTEDFQKSLNLETIIFLLLISLSRLPAFLNLGHLQHRCTIDTLADPYQGYSAGNPFQDRSAAEVPPANLISDEHLPQSQIAQQGWPAEYILSTRDTPRGIFQSHLPLQQSGLSQQVNPDFPQTLYTQHESFGHIQPSQYGIGASARETQQSLHRGRKRLRTDDNNPLAGPSTELLLPDTPSTMASMPHSGSLHSSVQDWSHGNEFLPHVQQMSQQQQQAYLGREYQPLASHHHRLPSQTRHTSLPRRYQASQLEVMTGGGTTSVVGQAGMPAPASRPRVPKLKFSAQEDQMLVELKENKNLTWKQIAEFFPGRTSGTLQVRYCTKLKAKTVIWTDESVSSILTSARGFESELTVCYRCND